MLLYLNFDGVLHPDRVVYKEGCTPTLVAAGHEELEHAGLLSQLLEPHDDLRLVLNTWWTFYLGLDACVEILPAPLSRRVVDSTVGYATSYDSIPSRAIELERHIATHGQCCFVVLDHSNARYRPELLPHLLLLDPDEGLAPLAARRSLATRLIKVGAKRPG
ncbi:HAD domain-containing protein [Paraburkholderia strydomiana]|uniref:HAD domain-containing protein n=1 Tax=Paraburkholderia strydomiana TaxID=1245417 RepID=UPI0038B884B3